MPIIDFTAGPWGAVNGAICSNQAMGNSFVDPVTDPSNTVSFIIASGKAEVDTVGANRMLFFTKVDCANTVNAAVTLVIRFALPVQRVTFRLNFDEHGVAPAIVNFYELPNNPVSANLARSLSLPWTSNAFVDVVYDSCCRPIQEITIHTDRPENNIDDLFWGPTQQGFVFRFRGRDIRLCLCVWPRIRRALSALFGG